ncbi:MAG: PHB depolymerase family esterase [Candidatus Accumulibacter propinquus]
MVADHGLDRRRVYVTGTSSGGAMTTVMLATYPEVFAGGAVLAGVPYRTAKGLQEGWRASSRGVPVRAEGGRTGARSIAAPGAVAEAVGLAWRRRHRRQAGQCRRNHQAMDRRARPRCCSRRCR